MLSILYGFIRTHIVRNKTYPEDYVIELLDV